MIAVFIIQPVITQKFQAELFAVKIWGVGDSVRYM
jgi:hypothetical protein